jgi:HAE1 family hydrophobic/amphiphilic exporter-1
MGGTQAPIQLQIRGPDVAELQRLSDQVVAAVRRLPGVSDVQSSLGTPRPELRIEVNRDVANQIGVHVGDVANTIRPLMAGQVATRWEDPTGEERDVVVQVPPELRRTARDIASIPVAASEKVEGRFNLVPLADLARITVGTAPAQIDRADLERVVTISGSPASGSSLSEASAAIRAEVDKLSLPAGYTARFTGETEMFEETVGYVLEAITLAVILIFLILASQFESFTQPFAIMLSLPLSLVGVLLALLLTDDTLNMMSMIGVIMLMGLVTKNAILLVDNANQRRAGGTERLEALVEAGAVRLRPIMMTTNAMIFGMLPIALALGEGGGFRAPMARAVIGGLITSTMLTLLVVPVAYTWLDDFGQWVKHRVVSRASEAALERELRESGAHRAPVWGDVEHEAPATAPPGTSARAPR